MKTINEQIVEKQDEYITYLKRLCGIKSVSSDKYESELSVLKAQAEQESNNRLQSEDSANNLKTAEEILKGEMSENLWTFICSYPVSYKSEEKLVEWIIDAMQEYATQFKAEQEKVTDEDIKKEALRRFTSNTGWIDHEKIDGFKRGAKAMRDGLITHTK